MTPDLQSLPDTPVFTPPEQAQLESKPHTRPYAAMINSHLLGLLNALGEFAGRMYGPPFPEIALNDPALAKEHDALVRFWWGREPYNFSDTESEGEFVFDQQRRDVFSTHKYIRRWANIRRNTLIRMLDTLGAYTSKASAVPQIPGPYTGLRRAIHAHNALLDFREKPFTLDEFRRSLKPILTDEWSGQSSVTRK